MPTQTETTEANTIVMGNQAELTWYALNKAGQRVEPSTVKLTLISPERKRINVSFTLSEQLYTAYYTPLVAGRWEYLWQGTGSVEVATEGVFWIKNSNSQ